MELEPTGALGFAWRVPSPTTSARSFVPMLAVGGCVYLAWWFAVEWLLPGSFNPLAGRLAVVAYFFASWALCVALPGARRHSETLYYSGALILVAHYFYLFEHNAQDVNWVVGTYVVVFALCVGVDSRRWLYVFAFYAFVCGAIVQMSAASLRGTIFLPGLATILALCVLVMVTRARLLDSLSESTARFQSLFDATFEGVAVHDRGTIIDVNASFTEMFGYTREELLGRSVSELNAPESRARVISQISEVPSGRYESIGLRKDGSRFAIEISTKPHVYRGRTVRLAAVRDVSDRQRAEQERMALIAEQAALASAREALRLRDEFISIASHELRTPITSLLLNVEVFSARWRKGDYDFETYTKRVRRQLGRMRRLVEELLDVSRFDAQPLTLARELVDLEQLAHDVTDALAEDLRRADCAISIHSTGKPHGLWDRLRIEQVIENLLRNALTHGAGHPIALVLTQAEGSVQLAVRDHGIGIEPDVQERIFGRYERGVSAKHYGGLGLGLYISSQIAEAHGGTLRVESKPGQGATFYLELPANVARSAEHPAIM